MEAKTAQPPSRSAGSSSAAYPRWVMLEKDCDISVGDSSCTAADAKTLAAARTSNGRLIQFSLHLAEPLAALRVCIEAPEGADDEVEHSYMVVAAHGDSLLVRVVEENDGYEDYTTDYFVYNAGDAAADPPRPPSLSLLPPCHVFYPTGEEEEEEEPEPLYLDCDATGLLRRGEDELVVAKLRTRTVKDRTSVKKVAELFLFRSGEWSVLRLPISCGNTGEVWQLPCTWVCDIVVPVGDRQLCWVHLSHGVLICDVFEESPRLQYLQLPMDAHLGQPSKLNRNVSATADGSALKLVNIFPRCCCGGAGASNCERSRHAYTMHTWTLRMDGGGMEWVKDGIVDASELWALDTYKGLPRVPLEHPIMSMDEHEPHVVYFQLCERHHVRYDADRTLWVLKVDTRSKTIQSVSRREDYQRHTLVPSNVFHFFNSYRPSNDASDGALTSEQRLRGIKRQRPAVLVDDELLVREEDASNPTDLQPSTTSFVEPSEGASEFLEAFLEISRYGLGGDELKAYRILSHDNGRRFLSLLRLPKNLRKDWLLMEIKASQAY